MIYSEVENEIREQLIQSYHKKGMMTFTHEDSTLIDERIATLERLVAVICEEKGITAKEFLGLVDKTDDVE